MGQRWTVIAALGAAALMPAALSAQSLGSFRPLQPILPIEVAPVYSARVDLILMQTSVPPQMQSIEYAQSLDSIHAVFCTSQDANVDPRMEGLWGMRAKPKRGVLGFLGRTFKNDQLATLGEVFEKVGPLKEGQHYSPLVSDLLPVATTPYEDQSEHFMIRLLPADSMAVEGISCPGTSYTSRQTGN